MSVSTGTNSGSVFCDFVSYKGRQVMLSHVQQNCLHEVAVVHHYEDGKHYCPTGFIICHLCGGVGEEPGPYECAKWGEP